MARRRSVARLARAVLFHGDRGFESTSLHQRVSCEPDFLLGVDGHSLRTRFRRHQGAGTGGRIRCSLARFPHFACRTDTRFGFEELGRRAGDYALAIALVVLRIDCGGNDQVRGGSGTGRLLD
jgi:hypothetical protein